AEDRASLTWQEIEHAPSADPFVFTVDDPELVLEDLPHHPLRPRFGYANPAMVNGAVAVVELVPRSSGTDGDAFGPPAPRVVTHGEDLVRGGGHGDVDAVGRVHDASFGWMVCGRRVARVVTAPASASAATIQ